MVVVGAAHGNLAGEGDILCINRGMYSNNGRQLVSKTVRDFFCANNNENNVSLTDFKFCERSLYL